MLEKPLTDIVDADIVALLENKVIEQSTLDYKRDLPSTDADRREILYDIASLANGRGGDLVFGIVGERDANDTPTGAPGEIVGVAGPNLDDLKLRLNQMIESCTKPRIIGVDAVAVGSFRNGPVVVLRVPPSWSGPHMVQIEKSQRFFGRSSAGRFLMEIDQIRGAFLASAALPERLDSLRRERIARIAANGGQIPLSPGAILVLHVVPFSSLSRSDRIAPEVLAKLSMPNLSLAGGGNPRINFDGYMMLSANSDRATVGYVQAFRSGFVESVMSRLVDGNPSVIGPSWFERTVIDATLGAVRGLPSIGAPPPYFVAVTLIGVKDSFIATSNTHRIGPIDRDVLFLPEVQVDGVPRTLQEMAETMRPSLDALWHAAGAPRSSNFTPDGVWRPR